MAQLSLFILLVSPTFVLVRFHTQGLELGGVGVLKDTDVWVHRFYGLQNLSNSVTTRQ